MRISALPLAYLDLFDLLCKGLYNHTKLYLNFKYNEKTILMVAGSMMLFAAAGFTTWKVYDNYQMSKFSPLMLANLEILSQLETWEDCGKPYFAPNGVIKAGETQYHTTVEANAKGEVQIGEENKAGFEAGKIYDVVYQMKNCERWDGACCDQREVGIFVVSATKRN